MKYNDSSPAAEHALLVRDPASRLNRVLPWMADQLDDEVYLARREDNSE